MNYGKNEVSADNAVNVFRRSLFTFSRGFMVAARMLLCFMSLAERVLAVEVA